MRISDWSSDVCSSDLRLDLFDDRVLAALHQILGLVPIAARLRGLEVPRLESVEIGEDAILVGEAHWPPPKFVIASAAKQSPARSSNAETGRASCRERGFQYGWIPGCAG